MSHITKQIAMFKVETSFNITGRGIVVVGIVTKGTVRLGACANILINYKPVAVTVSGIEHGNPDDQGIVKFGLLLRFADEECKKLAKDNRLQPQTIVLENLLT